jgi:hypothetical protein
MNLHCSRRLHNPHNIPRRDPTPRQNNNPSPRSSHQLRNPRRRLRRSNRSPRSQQPHRSRSNHILQRQKQIRTLIKRPVKRNRQSSSRPHQLRRPLDVNSPVPLQQSQHDTIHPRRLCRIDRSPHLLKLRRRINKIATPRPHHREYRHPHNRARRPHQLHARRDAPNLQRPTQFNPRSPTSLRRRRSLRTLHRDLYHSPTHRLVIPVLARSDSFPLSSFHFPISIFRRYAASLSSRLC